MLTLSDRLLLLAFELRLAAGWSLSEAGFEVLEAANGQEALALIEEHQRVAAVLTDLTMPELSGQELA